MHIEFLVEEPSTEAALHNLLPKIMDCSMVSFGIHPYQGKKDLLLKLPKRLRGYAKWLPNDWYIVVLVDKDRSDCVSIKGRMEKAAEDAGLISRTVADRGRSLSRFQVLNRIVIEELEAWFFGDLSAVNQAYPRIPKTLASRSRYHDPDSIEGGTWEALERELKKAGYFPGGLQKIKAARTISAYMEPDLNSSKSFQIFRDGLRETIRWGI